MKKFGLIAALLLPGLTTTAQVTGTIKGLITDEVTSEPIPFATVKLLNTDPMIGAVTDVEGEFKIEKVPVGRYSLEISFVGYEPQLVRELLVTSGRDVVVNLSLQESFVEMDEVVVTAKVNKLEPVNSLAGINVRMLSVEEANRYAGGFDDPARLASSFAGVSSGVQSNGIAVRGNNPAALLWRMEGVEISNPNHFADLATFGGGGLTALSSQMMANSDFLTGAFPAAYTNAISGVFDLSMRHGNSEKREYTLQAGLIGLDASSEGPLSKSGASYLFNYRYSTLGLIEPILPEDAGGTKYQDLAFKLRFPTKSAGVFSWWGIGLLDQSGQSIEEDMTLWEYETDQQAQDIDQYMGASGLKHLIYVSENAFMETDVAYTANGLDLVTDQMDDGSVIEREERIKSGFSTVVVQTQFNSQVGQGHTLEMGTRAYFQNYDLFLANRENDVLRTLVDVQGSSVLMSAFGQTRLRLSERWTFQGGINFQHFSLTGQSLVEPRASLELKTGQRSSVGISYGLHSRVERLNYYLNRDESGIQQNRNMGMTRSHHLVGSYALQLNDQLRLKVEPYYQYLFDVPVRPGSSFSFINLQNDWFISDKLKNDGQGRNVGIDVTFERFMHKGFYYLFTGTVFESRYTGGDGVWRSTAYDRGYVMNGLFGKEWLVGRNQSNMLGINARLNFQGGQRFVPVDEVASVPAMEVVEDEGNAYSAQLDPRMIIHFSASYRRNKANKSSVWTLSILNATMVEEFEGFAYNRQTNRIDQMGEPLMIPNISYKVEF